MATLPLARIAGMHHAVCVTDDEAAVLTFLRAVIGLEVASEVFLSGVQTTPILGWPAENAGASGVMLGSGSTGLVEVVATPPELNGSIRPGVAMLSFAVRDLETCVERCAGMGFAVSDIARIRSQGVDVSMAMVTVGSIRFELVRFESGRAAGEPT